MNKIDFSVKENSSQNTYDLSVGNESVSPFQNILQEALQNYEWIEHFFHFKIFLEKN